LPFSSLTSLIRINKKTWPLSVHELTAAIFYSLAEKRAERGNRPDGEEWTHRLREEGKNDDNKNAATLTDETDEFDPLSVSVANLLSRVDNFLEEKKPNSKPASQTKTTPPPPEPTTPGVCSPLSSSHLSSLLFYAPLSLSFIYSETPIELQLLSAQQGWSLLYAQLDQSRVAIDQPAYAVLVHRKRKIVALVVRGTTTLNDVVTDLRAIPVPFPEEGWGREMWSAQAATRKKLIG